MRHGKKGVKLLKKICLISVILSLLFSIGCSANKGPNSEDKSKAEPEIIEEAVSPDGKYTAYIVSKDNADRIFLGLGKDFQEAKEIDCDTDYIKEIIWSPNSKFFFAGNADFYKGAIFSVKDLRYIPMQYESGPFWSPDGYKLCFSQYSRVKPSDKSHSVITFDVVVKDLCAAEYLMPEVLARGSADYCYKVNGWDENGEIKYEKRSLDDDKLIAKLTGEYAHYLWSLNTSNNIRREIGKIPDLGHRYFNISPDKKWVSMVKITCSGGEAEGGIPAFFNLETGELRDVGKEFSTLFWNPKWFDDSSKILLNENSIYDVATGKLTEYELPAEKNWLGAKPSPDRTKLAILGCNQVHSTNSEGEPLIVYIAGLDGKILKTIQTSMLPEYSSNMLAPMPVEFDWMADGKNLIIEAWNQATYATTLQKLDIISEMSSLLAINTYGPLLSPDGKKIAMFYTDKPQKNRTYTELQVLDLESKVLSGFYIKGGGNITWNDDSESVLIWGDYREGRDQVLTIIDIGTGKVTSFEAKDFIRPLYIRGKDMVYVGGAPK